VTRSDRQLTSEMYDDVKSVLAIAKWHPRPMGRRLLPTETLILNDIFKGHRTSMVGIYQGGRKMLIRQLWQIKATSHRIALAVGGNAGRDVITRRVASTFLHI